MAMAKAKHTTKSRTPSTDPEIPPPPHPIRKPKPSPPPNRRRRRRLLIISLASLLFLLALFHTASAVLRRANRLGRRCMPEPPISRLRPLKIAMVSFSDEKQQQQLKRRSFQGLMDAVGGNKRAYATAMGYEFIDAGGLVDPRRPPNWSKIPAVRHHLRRFDWIFWHDADTVVANPKIRLEHVLLSAVGHADLDTSPDLVVTADYNGVNSGVFFVRRSEWSEGFLDTWWNQTALIRFGSTRSGDNAAMKLLIDGLSDEEFKEHVAVAPMQCSFNSYPWFSTWKNVVRLIISPATTWRGVYSDGDFLIHLAGLDDKTKWATDIVQEMKSSG